MVDVETLIAKALKDALGITVFLEVPEGPPDSFLVVEQTSMGTVSDHVGNAYLATVNLDIDCWCPKNQRKQAKSLANSVIKSLPTLGTDPITTTKCTNTYRSNDPDTGRSRYVVQVETTILMKED